MVRLTADLIRDADEFLNPLKERELALRGRKAPVIENMGSARDPDAIDLTDNEIAILGNFAMNKSLRTLLCGRNRIHSIHRDLSKSLPNLTTLVLTQNNISDLAELEPLKGFKKLTHVSLVKNAVTNQPNYRYWILHLNENIRFLDFAKVKDVERAQAKKLFGTVDEPSDAAKAILAARASNGGATVIPTSDDNGRAGRFQIDAKLRKRIDHYIRTTDMKLGDINRITKDLQEGRVPAEFRSDVMDET